MRFPFLFGGTFIEGCVPCRVVMMRPGFPFLFGGTFIEGQIRRACPHEPTQISLPFRRGFHGGEVFTTDPQAHIIISLPLWGAFIEATRPT